MRDLVVITPCSRPGNLGMLAQSIFGHGLDVRWIVVVDGTKHTNIIAPLGAEVYYHANPDSKVGMAQRNYALEVVTDGWLYFLDDDNLMHPRFWHLYPHMAGGRYLAYTFDQELDKGVRIAAPENTRPGMVDMAQILVRRDLVGDTRFEYRYEADGIFIGTLWARNRSAFGHINLNACYYNKLVAK